ncbi:hypothetical protein NQ315_003577 [Exocentrus adspersus]|uniref:Reverse transcriptase domain-containing protein n=1 Tax=Exocentrus adspersus TaxID=1586481 RepID=A0AAV8VAG6_9CUCU|nr:hypothetical protein NQ315_003577 [Exocentrus adspersus]
MAMGSSLSPIMSNIFMEHFEETYVKIYINKPKIWWRYVDDVFSIWPHGQDNLTDFLNFLNNIEPTIKFTLELEENNKLPFLDVMISKNTEINSNFQTNVYRKKTNTNRYLNFNSNHHLSIKKGVIKKAKLVSSNVNFFNQEKDHIKNILKENAYPINLVDKAFLQIENPSHNNQQRQNPVANMTIPYIPGISEKLKKLGETSRPLDVRIKEHKTYVRNYQVDRSNLAQHVWDNHHQINWKEASIIQKEQNFGKRKLKESACIQLNVAFLGQTEKVVYSQTMSFQLNPTAPQISYRQYVKPPYPKAHSLQDIEIYLMVSISSKTEDSRKINFGFFRKYAIQRIFLLSLTVCPPASVPLSLTHPVYNSLVYGVPFQQLSLRGAVSVYFTEVHKIQNPPYGRI